MGDKNVAVFRRKNPYFSHEQREKRTEQKYITYRVIYRFVVPSHNSRRV